MKFRLVCKHWRSVSNISLLRRFVIKATAPSEETNHQLVTIKPKIKIHEQPLSSRFRATQAAIIEEMAQFQQFKLVIRRRCPRVALLYGTLHMDWRLPVTTLELKYCISITDWNTLGLKILKFFKLLERLVLKFHDFAHYSLTTPLCYTDIADQSSSIDDSLVNQETFILREFQLHCSFENRTPELPRIWYGFLDKCQILQVRIY